MTLIAWDNKFSVKIDEIDKQHKKLFSMINELYISMKEGRSDASLIETINGLIDYTHTHFRNEERYMVKFEYPGYVRHKKEHDEFVAEVKGFHKKLIKGEASLTLEILVFLKDWITKHINGSDQKYAPYFHEKGLN